MRTALLTLCCFCVFAQAYGQSVLSSGPWFKVGVTESGVYKLDRTYLSRTLGINLASFDPRTFKIYGSGFNGMLPQQNDIARNFDPVEYAIFASGEEDGMMDDEDFFLFYGNGPDHFSLDTTGAVNYEKNIYSDTTYFLITYGGENGRRINAAEDDTSFAGAPVTSYTDFIVHEEDETNFLRSGRRWFGPQFYAGTSLNQEFSYQKAGLKGPVEVKLVLVARSEGDCSFDVLLNDKSLGNVPIDKVTGEQYDNKAKEAVESFTTTVNGDKIDLRVRFNPSSGVFSLGYIDYFIISYERELRLYGDQTEFRLPHELTERIYQIQGADAQSRLWDISDVSNVVSVHFAADENMQIASSGGAYLVSKGNNFPAPQFVHPMNNQNLKSFAGKEGIIVTHPDFLVQAKRLGEFHQSNSGLSVGVVTTTQIYNEFSAGMQDISAIRDYFKYCYDVGGSLKYVTLFGDGSYDYKRRVQVKTNYIPVYESRNSFHPIFSFSSDDFYAFLEDDEGEWEEGKQVSAESWSVTGFVDHTLEIGVGRLPVKNQQEAEDVVDKIIRYKTSAKTLGSWRNDIAYLTDDGDNGSHMADAEKLFKIFDTTYITYNAKKLHLDAFEQEIVPPNEYSPKAQEALLAAMEDGVFILNYLGHGGEERLTDEWVVSTGFISQLNNRQRLPLIMTATCDFGKYDDPGVISGAERLILKENGGAIALLTTTRPVFSTTNMQVNTAFHTSVFHKIDGEWPRLGDVQRLTKNGSLGGGPVNRNFALLGDAMLRLNYPQYEISFDPLEGETDTLSALEVYHLSGRITNGDNSTNTAFDGKGIVTLWDIPQKKVTKGQENAPFTYEDQVNALYRGEVSVNKGVFQADFILPKNTSYKYQPGKLVMYAWNEKEFVDASGGSRNFVLGGTADHVTPDNNPPTLRIYLNDSSFSSGNTVGTNSLLIAKLSDESGINISNNGFNQSITLTLNDQDPVELNEFYTAHMDDYTKGTVMFPLRNLDPGKYTATLKVWDTHNNPASSTVEFKVSDKPILSLYNTRVYPNPVASHQELTFDFEHDREGEELLVNIAVYNMMGGEVQRLDFQVDNSSRKVEGLKWRVSNDRGGDLERGIYLYRLSVTSTQDGAYNEVIKRLVIIN